MNLQILWRAVQRHRHMQDAPAYEALLAHARDQGGVWFAPQGEVAEWWERRHRARLSAEFHDREMSIVNPLQGGVLEVDGELRCEDRILVPVSVTQAGFPTAVEGAGGGEFLRELLAHLGYGHVESVPAGGGPDLSGPRWAELLQSLDSSARVHQRYEPDSLSALRALIQEAHRRRGIPDVRIWPWPHEGGRPWQVVLSPRYDVDKAIVNLPRIHELEARYGARSTVYLRPMGLFYGSREIRACRSAELGHELALHGEFLSTAESDFETEGRAAVGEKERLEELTGSPIGGVCMHGGELRTNTSPATRDAIESAGYLYETMYRNRYYFPLHIPGPHGLRRTLSIGQHSADISVALAPGFADDLATAFISQFDAAASVGGVFVPVMHPLYFGVGNYLKYPTNVVRILAFLPKFVRTASRMRSGQAYSNR